MNDLRETIYLIEELAANAWPAPVQQQLGPWKLRAGNGVTQRANSVLAVGGMPVYGVEDARAFLSGEGIDVDAIAPQVDGKFMSAFVRAVKP